MDKYFIEKFAYTGLYEDIVLLSNRVSGDWVKIPKVCYDVIKDLNNKKLPINCGIDYFCLKDDKNYYEKVVNILENIDLVSEYPDEDFYFENVEILTISLSNRCNLFCPYCSTNANSKSEDLSTDDLLKVMHNMMVFKPRKVVLTGGEPMLRGDFFEILKELRNIFSGEIQLITNGTLINDKNIESISMVDSFCVSIDGYNSAIVSKTRGDGVFNKVMNTVTLLKKIGKKKVGLSMVFGENDIDKMTEFAKFCSDIEVRPIFRHFSRFGRGVSNTDYIKDKKIAFLSTAITDRKVYMEKAVSCNPGNLQMFVNYDGNVYPCQNLVDENLLMFDAKHLSDELVETIRRRKHVVFERLDKINTAHMKECSECKHKLFCGFCHANTKIMVSDKDIFEKTCMSIKNVDIQF